MNEQRLEAMEREFSLFESKVHELERLKKDLDSLDSGNFKNEAAAIRKSLSDVNNIPRIERAISNLKLKIEKKAAKSSIESAQLIDQIFRCNDNIDAWSYGQLKKEYNIISRKYIEIPRNEKVFVYNILMKLYEKIKVRKR